MNDAIDPTGANAPSTKQAVLWRTTLRAAAFVATGSLLLLVGLVLGNASCALGGISIDPRPALPVFAPLLFAFLVGRSGYIPASRNPEHWLHIAGLNSALWLVVFYVITPRLGAVTADTFAIVAIGVAAVSITFLGAIWGRRRAT